MKNKNMVVQGNEVKKSGKKKSLRLKKSVRRTSGALLLVTALIVAAIPTGNASATTAYDEEEDVIIPEDGGGSTDYYTITPESYEDIIANPSTVPSTSVPTPGRKPTSGLGSDSPYDTTYYVKGYAGFPIVLDEIIKEDGSKAYEPAKTTYTDDYGNEYTYYTIDLAGYSNSLALADPIFALDVQGKTSAQVRGNGYISYFKGSDNFTTDTLNMGNMLGYSYGDAAKEWSNTAEKKHYREFEADSKVVVGDITYDLNGLKLYEFSENTYSSGYEPPSPDDPIDLTPKPYYDLVVAAPDGSITIQDDDGDNRYAPGELITIFTNEVKNESELQKWTIDAGGFTSFDHATGTNKYSFYMPYADVYVSSKWLVLDNYYYVCNDWAPLANICDDAFSNTQASSSLATITMPDNLMYIGDNAFKNCARLKTITFGAKLSSIGKEAFENCASLESIYYASNLGGINLMGDGAFANDPALTAFEDVNNKTGSFIMPYSNGQYGNAVFYNTGITRIRNFNTNKLEIGDYFFANCANLKSVDLESYIYSDETGDIVVNNNPNIKNLGTVNNLFTNCVSLEEVHLPTGFSGRLKLGTFYNTHMKTLEFRNHTSDCSDGEFNYARDYYDFEILGPNPLSMEVPATSDNTLGYLYALKHTNSYTYKSMNSDGSYYYYGKAFMDDDDVSSEAGYALRVLNTSGNILDSHEYLTGFTGPKNLVIPAKIGSQIINGIGNPEDTISKDHGVFEGDKFNTLTINPNIKTVGKSAFANCDALTDVKLNTEGVELKDDAFAGDDSLKNVLFNQTTGSGSTAIGNRCFYECPALDEVAFYDDNYTRSKPLSANVTTIGDKAFFSNTRTSANPLVLKGEMRKGYAPYMFAIHDMGEREDNYLYNGTANDYVVYKTGNPENLECQYYARDNVNKLPAGVYLLDYPHLFTDVTNNVIDPDNRGTTVSDLIDYKIKYEEGSLPPGSPKLSGMMDAIIESTQTVRIPDGIDYLEKLSYYDPVKGILKKYFQEADGLENLILEGPVTYPDETFKNSLDLETVTFTKNIIDLGKLPFAVDEDETVFPHEAASNSKLYDVSFAAGDPSYTNSNGVIKKKSDDGSVELVEILPGRGNLPQIDNVIVDETDLADVTVIAPHAARDCDSIEQLNLTHCPNLGLISEGAFEDCDQLGKIWLPKNVMNIEKDAFGAISGSLDVHIPSVNTSFNDDVFTPATGETKNPNVTLWGPNGDENVEKKFGETKPGYASYYKNVHYKADENKEIKITFKDLDGLTVIVEYTIKSGGIAKNHDLYPASYLAGPEYEWRGMSGTSTTVVNETDVLTEDTIFVLAKRDMVTVTFVTEFGDIVGTEDVAVNTFVPTSKILEVEAALPVYAGKAFDKWNPNPRTVRATSTINTYTAYYTTPEKIHTVRYMLDDTTVYNTFDVKDGDPFPPIPITPSITGKVFKAWNPDPSAYVDKPVTSDLKFVAVWGDESTTFTAFFYDYDGTLLSKQSGIPYGSYAKVPSVTINRPGYTFLGFTPDVATTEITEDTNFTARYVPDNPETPTPTPTGQPTPTPTPTSKPGPTKTPITKVPWTPTPLPTSSSEPQSSSSQGSSSKGSSSQASSSSSVSIATPYYVTSQDASGQLSTTATVYINNGGNGGGNNNNTQPVNTGNTRVESTRDGISSTDKLSATVNGSTDNYVVKLSRTQEADDCALAALSSTFGSDLSAIRYLPFDISLYDSTGTNKIEPVPEGMSVTLTMPIPDDLVIYGGNAKIASTVGGNMERIQPKFTMINGVPCMTFTAPHLSPYMVYVDTANLTEAGISDITPKTADGIHPKWFLSIGLAALAIVLLIKRDPEEYFGKKAAM